MLDFLMQQKVNGLLVLCIYWLPLSLCAFGYTVRTWRNYRADVKARETAKFYSPTDTIGTLIGRAIATAFPVVNAWAAAFDIGPMLFGHFFEWLGEVFSQPLVPGKPNPPTE